MTIKTQYFDAQPPFTFGLTVTGDLTVEWEFRVAGVPNLSVLRMGVVIPAAEVRTLRRCLAESQTIQETLSAKEPEQGAH
jgi:hypothetical protein